MEEVWVPVNGYEGRYEVSSLGNVRGLCNGEPRLLRPSTGSDGRYLHVVFSVNGKRKTHTVHRLVAEAFHGGANGLHCCHNNGNTFDNRAENLRWATAKENIADKKKHGTHIRGTQMGSNRWTEEQVGMVIRREVSSTQAIEMWGMPQPTYQKITSRTTWSWHPAWND